MAEKKEAAYVPAPLLEVSEVEKQIKPLSKNKFLAFFQNLFRKWLTFWYGFSDKHPKLSKLIYQVAFFVLFSMLVTVFQFLVFLFLPNLFGLEMAKDAWLLPPGVQLGEAVAHVPNLSKGQFWAEWSQTFNFFFLGKPVIYNEAGQAILGGGNGYFFSFLIATFLAQVINLPLQRNITFRSHGNPYFQALWYFIGWILIQPFCDMLGSLWTPLAMGALGFVLPNVIKVLLDTIIMGGVAMAIFFVVFLIIFPDYNKVEKTARKKLEKLKAANAPAEKIAKAETALKDAEMRAKNSNAQKNADKTASQASASAISYFATVKNLAKAEAALPSAKDKEKAEQRVEVLKVKVPEKLQRVSDAVQAKEKAAEDYAAVKVEFDAYEAELKAAKAA